MGKFFQVEVSYWNEFLSLPSVYNSFMQLNKESVAYRLQREQQPS